MAVRLAHPTPVDPVLSVALDTFPAVAYAQVIDELIDTSDAAMYEAKRAGGNQVHHTAPNNGAL